MIVLAVLVTALVLIVGLVIMDGGGTHGSGTTIRDRSADLSIEVPDGWSGRLADGAESGFRVWRGNENVFDPDCEGVNESVRITVFEREWPNLPTVSRPERFTRHDGSTDTWRTLAEIECDEVWQRIQFSEHGRVFQALIVTGRAASESSSDEARQILDSFQVK